MRERFWERYPLAELDGAEWEALCDGCGRCCLLKLEDEESGDIATLDLACQLLDIGACHCSDYPNRSARVPGCVPLTLARIEEFRWLPGSCAYRRLSEGRGLAEWHPLVSGDRDSVRRAGISVAPFAVSETTVPEAEWEDHIIDVLPCED
ncbi:MULTISPECIES: YcgN family cysteine cluster protein [unclassified Modicisalibacter]|uniref:YcgN family cysteine cluster protein n=1 Tax=unclassified Modicisalibacter TaxID=2679913 RepID=UPI001CCFD1A0|nr:MULTISPECIES: YcgN family cysteine cluster protein [unclassified Modicisalibacter]MBZ9560398.1 YcgN family cysteine cluster protein [Modicisalibacter sp. R2A 31.J]MBZ9576307.1 YcgN family cysteine cluster protein [Modicisalibacter sp. MOD 31.J]